METWNFCSSLALLKLKRSKCNQDHFLLFSGPKTPMEAPRIPKWLLGSKWNRQKVFWVFFGPLFLQREKHWAFWFKLIPFKFRLTLNSSHGPLRAQVKVVLLFNQKKIQKGKKHWETDAKAQHFSTLRADGTKEAREEDRTPWGFFYFLLKIPSKAKIPLFSSLFKRFSSSTQWRASQVPFCFWMSIFRHRIGQFWRLGLNCRNQISFTFNQNTKSKNTRHRWEIIDF